MRQFRTFVLPMLAAVLVVTCLTVSPAEACRQHDAGLPQSASVEGALADFLVATQGMTRKQRAEYEENLSDAVRKELRREIRALPKEERKALTRALRLSRVDKANKAPKVD